jgi:hypothetical protein
MSTHADQNLTWNSGRLSSFVFTGALLLAAGCEGRRPVSDGVLDSLVAANPCNESAPAVTRAPDSLTPPQSCALVAAAMRRLSQARSGDLPQLADTSRVTPATIDPMSELDFSEREKGAWWVVTLQLRDTPFNAEVRFDRQTGATGIRPVH